MFLKKCTCIKRKCSCRRISSSKLISNWTRMEQKHTALFGTSKKMKMVKNIWFKIFVLKIRKKFLPKKKTKITTTLRLQENAKKQKKNVFWTQRKPLNEQLMQISYRKAVQARPRRFLLFFFKKQKYISTYRYRCSIYVATSSDSLSISWARTNLKSNI